VFAAAHLKVTSPADRTSSVTAAPFIWWKPSGAGVISNCPTAQSFSPHRPGTRMSPHPAAPCCFPASANPPAVCPQKKLSRGATIAASAL